MAHPDLRLRRQPSFPQRSNRLFFRGALTALILSSAALVLIAGCTPLAAAAASEATFERTLSVNGSALQLTVMTGSGNIQLTRGADTQIHIVGHVKAGWGASQSQVRQVAANPPIEQTGNIVRIGGKRQDLRHIRISYEIEAPANAFVNVSTGSGDIADDGVGENAKLSTGSGNVRATGLRGAFTATSGSGNIHAEQAGGGDVKVSTGSGNIDLRDLHGGLDAGTGSGNIKVAGTPASLWHVHTGSGNVELWPGNAAFTLDASTGSGSIDAGRALTHGTTSKHHVTGNVGGGGPAVKISTGSGNILIH
jgi:hypothetical protein